MDECRLCAAALAAATRTHTGLAPLPGGGVQTVEERHVDSELLAHWLRSLALRCAADSVVDNLLLVHSLDSHVDSLRTGGWEPPALR